MPVLRGLELATGTVALLPAAWYLGWGYGAELARNWGDVYLGNSLGGMGFAVLAVAAVTGRWSADGGAVGARREDGCRCGRGVARLDDGADRKGVG